MIVVSLGCGGETAVVVAPTPGTTSDPNSTSDAEPSAGASIPDIAVMSVADLKTKMSALQGNVVLLDLWATW